MTHRILIIITLLWIFLFIPGARPESFLSNEIPLWVTNVPEHCFVGISKPCDSIEEARQQAILSAVSQILQTMGASYSLTHESKLSGTVMHSRHQMNEKLIYTANWFIRSIQESIVNSKMYQDNHQYVYFVLVHFPPPKIDKLRKLTIGAKISARVIEQNRDGMIIEAIETNGVGVTLTDYRMKITNMNRHAGIITLFAWKVPKSSTRKFESVLSSSIHLQSNSKIFNIPNAAMDSRIGQLLLGTATQVEMTLRGYDEIGRTLSVAVQDLP